MPARLAPSFTFRSAPPPPLGLHFCARLSSPWSNLSLRSSPCEQVLNALADPALAVKDFMKDFFRRQSSTAAAAFELLQRFSSCFYAQIDPGCLCYRLSRLQ